MADHDTSPKVAQGTVYLYERVSAPHEGLDYCVRFTAPEFTSLCPMTGQPDFAHLVIDYVPGDWLVESKSLKLYLGSFAMTRITPCSSPNSRIRLRISCICRGSRPTVGSSRMMTFGW